MTNRRVLWTMITILSLLAVVGLVGIAWAVLQAQSAQPIQLAVVGTDERLRLVQPNGEERVLAENVDITQYQFPAVSPDGRALAYIMMEDDDWLIVRLNLATNEQRELYRSSINRPFDLAWSPDGRYLLFLLVGQAGLTTNIVPQDGSADTQLIATGRASYFAWHPDSTTLLLHQNGHMGEGGRIDTYRAGEDRARPLLNNPSFFQAPAWSVDGKSFFYVAQPPFPQGGPTIDDLQGQIVRVAADGTDPQVLASEEQSDIRIVRAPQTDQLAYIALPFTERGVIRWGPLQLIEADGQTRTLSRPDEQVTSFFWSPDGAQIAYLTYDGEFSRNGPRTWRIVSVGDGTIRDLETFTPSEPLAELQLFFDAYLYALSPWSPDGRQLAYGTVDGVYVVDIASGQTTRRADGDLGVWVGGR